MFELQLSLLGRSTKFEPCRKRVTEIVTALSTKTDIPTIARHGELIEEILTEDWWTGLTVPIVERARLRLRDLVHLIDQASRPILYTDFEDELGVATGVILSPTADFAAFKKKARAFFAGHENHLALRKLRLGKPLTELDISELERMLLDAGIATDADIAAARSVEAAQVMGFGVFLRSLVGLDRGAAQEHFAAFIPEGARADQIEFIAMVIEYLAKSGVIDPGMLYTSPFTDASPDGPDGLFDAAVVEDLFGKLRGINESAAIYLTK
jgi:type I restriction enzyme R subunit